MSPVKTCSYRSACEMSSWQGRNATWRCAAQERNPTDDGRIFSLHCNAYEYKRKREEQEREEPEIPSARGLVASLRPLRAASWSLDAMPRLVWTVGLARDRPFRTGA